MQRMRWTRLSLVVEFVLEQEGDGRHVLKDTSKLPVKETPWRIECLMIRCQVACIVLDVCLVLLVSENNQTQMR